MIILRNNLFSSSNEKNDKLTKGEKAAIASSAAGLAVAGLGQKHAGAKKKEYLKGRQDWYESYGWAKDKAKREADQDWKFWKPKERSLKGLRKSIKREQKWINEIEKLGKKAADEDLGNLRVEKHTLGQNKILLSRKKGKIAANTGLAATAAGLGYLGYSEYKKHKKKD